MYNIYGVFSCLVNTVTIFVFFLFQVAKNSKKCEKKKTNVLA